MTSLAQQQQHNGNERANVKGNARHEKKKSETKGTKATIAATTVTTTTIPSELLSAKPNG